MNPRLRVALVAIAILVAGCAHASDNLIEVSGRIEGDDAAIASKQPGKVASIRVNEGDTVRAGDIIAVLDDAQARAAVADATAKLAAARGQIPVLEAQQNQAQIGAEQAGTNASGLVGEAQGQLDAARAQLSQAQAASKLASYNQTMAESLYKTGDIAELQRNKAESDAQQAAATVTAAQHRVQAAQAAVTNASASNANAPIRQQQAAAVGAQINQASSTVQSATAGLTAAKANLRDLTVRAPFDGVVLVRTAEPGEVLAAGTPIVTLLPLNKLYLRGFVPEGQIGSVKLGQQARVYLDNDPSHAHPYDAYVLSVDPQSMFTPENTYFKNDRVQQVVGVKLALRNGFQEAKAGMPADGEILIGGTWPK
jgi:HlyD family secretion protein